MRLLPLLAGLACNGPTTMPASTGLPTPVTPELQLRGVTTPERAFAPIIVNYANAPEGEERQIEVQTEAGLPVAFEPAFVREDERAFFYATGGFEPGVHQIVSLLGQPLDPVETFTIAEPMPLSAEERDGTTYAVTLSNNSFVGPNDETGPVITEELNRTADLYVHFGPTVDGMASYRILVERQGELCSALNRTAPVVDGQLVDDEALLPTTLYGVPIDLYDLRIRIPEPTTDRLSDLQLGFSVNLEVLVPALFPQIEGDPRDELANLGFVLDACPGQTEEWCLANRYMDVQGTPAVLDIPEEIAACTAVPPDLDPTLDAVALVAALGQQCGCSQGGRSVLPALFLPFLFLMRRRDSEPTATIG